MTEKIKKEYQTLVSLIEKYSYEYYTLDQPSVTDNEYDSVYQQLLVMEKEYPELITSLSPSQRVGNKILDGFQKINRTEQMASLEDKFNLHDLESWYADTTYKCLNMPNSVLNSKAMEMVAEMKIDGLSIELIYENGELQYAATRGNGYEGEIVTDNVLTIKSIPAHIPEKRHVEVRGEIYMPKASLDEINKERISQNLAPFANCRNAAAGTLRNLDTSVCKKRKLNAWLYYFWNAKDFGIHNHYDSLAKLKEWGFRTNPEARLITNIGEMKKYVTEYTEKRKSLDYDIDGIVLKVNQFDFYDYLGKTAKVPHWAIAYKFPPEKVITKLENITYQVGRTGKITPVAELSPTLVSGSMIRRATLHNEDYIIDKDIRIGDFVTIIKAGDVIPAVESVVKERRTGKEQKFKMITNCPICNAKLEKIDAHHFCTNPECPEQKLNALIHFCEKDAMDIDGLGEKMCELLYENKFITDQFSIIALKDLAKTSLEKLIALDGVGLEIYPHE